MKINLSKEILNGEYDSETYLLIKEEGEVQACSGNTEFADLGLSIPNGEYNVVKLNYDDEGEISLSLIERVQFLNNDCIQIANLS
jgi:hypothetical protein